MGNVISKSQKAFMEGREILDTSLIVNEVTGLTIYVRAKAERILHLVTQYNLVTLLYFLY